MPGYKSASPFEFLSKITNSCMPVEDAVPNSKVGTSLFALDEMIETYNPDYEGARLPMKYALYKDGVPVIGNMEKLLDIEFFYLPDNITIQPGSKSRFTLLWLWESESDEKDVDIASSVKSYTLIVNVTAGMSD